MKRISGLLVIVMLLSVFAFGCGGGDDENTPVASGIAVEGDVINIGVFEPTTGENGGGGMQEVLGVRYANSLYPTVEINGTTYTIALKEVDNQSDKAAAVTAAQSLISQKVVAVIGSYGSGVSIAAGETFQSARCSCSRMLMHKPSGDSRKRLLFQSLLP